MDSNDTVYIGRDNSNDIVIDNQSVSRHHATITVCNGEYRIQDNNSLNGVFVNGQKVDSAEITPHDSISLGTTELLDWNTIIRAMGKKSTPFESVHRQDNRPSSAFAITIGRSEDNDIVINEPEISRQHARITTELYPDKQVFEIQDIQSQNGTYVNGERISRKSLTPSDRITLGTKTQLSWDQIAYAINQKMSSDIPTPEPLGPSIPHFEERTYIPEPEFQNGYQPQSPRNRSNPGLLIAGVVVGLFILIGGIMVVASGKGRLTSTGSQMNSQAQLINLSSKYQLKPGEPQDIAQRRAKIEAQRELLEKVKESYPNSNSFATNYAVFNPSITNQTYLDDEQAFITDISAEMSMPDFEAKMDYINTHQDMYDRLEALQNEYDANYSLVGEAESNMIQSYQTYQESGSVETPSSFDYAQRGASPSVQQYYNDCVATYLEQIELTENTITALSEQAGTLNQMSSSATVDLQDPRDIYVDAVNGNWTTKEELLAMFEDNPDGDSSKDTMTDFLDGQFEKDAIMYQLYHELLGCFLQENERIVISENDLTVTFLSNDLASVTFTEAACNRLSKSIVFQDDTPQVMRDNLNRNYNGLQEKYEGSMNNINQSMINYLKEAKYIVRESGKWKLSIWDETLRE